MAQVEVARWRDRLQRRRKAMKPYLEIVEGFDMGRRFEISAEPLTIGRSPANRFCLPDSRASRQHAQVRAEAGQIVIEDLNSANGTFVNDQRLEPGKPYILQPGDEIVISATRMRFYDQAPTAAVLPTGDDSLLSVVLVGEEQDKQPQEVNLTIDASRSMMDLREEEKQSLSGMQEAVRRLQAMVKIAAELGAVTRQEAILQRIMENIFAVFPHADRAFIMLRDKKTGEMMPTAARYRQPKAGAKEEFAFSRTILNTAVKLRQSVLSSDAQRDQRFGLQQSIVNLSIRSLMCAPFICQDEILGVINVDTVSGTRAFTADDLTMLTGLAAQAAVALKNAELYEEVKLETQKRTHLSRYMSPDVVQAVLDGNIPIELGGRRVHGTVFFGDIIGFTAMSERMDPLEIVTLLNRHMRATTEVVIRNRGTLHKFGGDMIMAFWGVMFPDETPEQNAIRAGLEMQAEVYAFGLALQAEGRQPILMGVGCNTGDFLAGNIGGEERFEYTVIGDNVNLAQRIESLAGRWQMLVSADTLTPAKERCIAVELPPVNVKGKAAPVRIYSVRGLATIEQSLILLLPCRLLSAAGESLGDGMITAAAKEDGKTLLTLLTSAGLTPEEEIALELSLAELCAPPRLTARVAGEADITSGGGRRFHLIVADGHGDVPLLQPGAIITSDRRWEEMKRQ